MDCPDYSWSSAHRLLELADGVAYVHWPSRFERNVTELLKAFGVHYPRVRIGYSYKTNYLPKLCTAAQRLGLYAEVVSGTEYALARLLDIPGSDIIFNGPVKSDSELVTAFSQGALVNVDSLSEARQIAELLSRTGLSARLGLRCNLDLEWNGRRSRFGMGNDSDELIAARRLLDQCPHATVVGLHCHTSYDRSAISYRRRASRMIELADELFPESPPQFIDVGGGMAGPMPDSLIKQLRGAVADYAEYAKAICEPLLARYGDSGPELIVEPGVGLVGDVMDYVYRVEHIKHAGSQTIAVTSGAAHQIKIVTNDINPPTCTLAPPLTADNQRNNGPFDLVGFTCLEHDLIYRGYEGNLQRGDILVSACSGAYSMTTSPDFIRTTPPVFELNPEGDWNLLRRQLSAEELLDRYRW